MNNSPYILVLYYSRYGATKKLAEEIAHGIESVKGIEARLRTVPEISSDNEEKTSVTSQHSDLFVTKDDLRHCYGLALGSPTRFGNMAAPLKHFIDSTSDLWMSAALLDKPATVFTSTATMHGGQETTLISMMLPLLHQGMIILGLPYSNPDLTTTKTGGSPYGVSHMVIKENDNSLSEEEIRLARSIGKRLAMTALKLIN